MSETDESVMHQIESLKKEIRREAEREGNDLNEDVRKVLSKRVEVLREAERIVTKDRQAMHGKPEDSFAKIAEFWSDYLGMDIRSHDIACLMILFKVARSLNNPSNPENWVDIIGYGSCGFEVSPAELLTN